MKKASLCVVNSDICKQVYKPLNHIVSMSHSIVSCLTGFLLRLVRSARFLLFGNCGKNRGKYHYLLVASRSSSSLQSCFVIFVLLMRSVRPPTYPYFRPQVVPVKQEYYDGSCLGLENARPATRGVLQVCTRLIYCQHW